MGLFWGGNGYAEVHQQPILGMCSTDNYFNNLYTTLQAIKKFNNTVTAHRYDKLKSVVNLAINTYTQAIISLHLK